MASSGSDSGNPMAIVVESDYLPPVPIAVPEQQTEQYSTGSIVITKTDIEQCRTEPDVITRSEVDRYREELPHITRAETERHRSAHLGVTEADIERYSPELAVIVSPEECLRYRASEILIREEDTVNATVIEQPSHGQQFRTSRIDVRGRAQGGSDVRLEIGAYSEEALADARSGAFHFQRVPLQPEENLITVSSTNYPYPKCTASVRVVCIRSGAAYLGRRDPYTQNWFKPGDEVVRCKRCGNYALRSSWRAMKGCALPSCEGNRQYWTLDEAEFYQEETETLEVGTLRRGRRTRRRRR